MTQAKETPDAGEDIRGQLKALERTLYGGPTLPEQSSIGTPYKV